MTKVTAGKERVIIHCLLLHPLCVEVFVLGPHFVV